MENLNEQISRIRSMMGLMTEEESDVKFRELKKMGFEWDYKEEYEGLVKERLYYIIPSTSNCNVIVGFKKSRYVSAALAIDQEVNGDGLITINSSKTKINADQMCEDVYDEFMLKYIEQKINEINSQGLNETNVSELVNLVQDKKTLKNLSAQGLAGYVPQEPKNITKDNIDISAVDDNLVVMMKSWQSDKDPSKLFKFDKPLVTYELSVKQGLISADLELKSYIKETDELELYVPIIDKTIKTKLTEDQKNTIINGINNGYLNNKTFVPFEMKVNIKENPSDPKSKSSEKTIEFKPKDEKKQIVNIIPDTQTNLVQN